MNISDLNLQFQGNPQILRGSNHLQAFQELPLSLQTEANRVPLKDQQETSKNNQKRDFFQSWSEKLMELGGRLSSKNPTNQSNPK